MPYYTFKRSGKNRYLVLRWKKRINGIPTIVKEVSVGTAEDLAEILENDLSDTQKGLRRQTAAPEPNIPEAGMRSFKAESPQAKIAEMKKQLEGLKQPSFEQNWLEVKIVDNEQEIIELASNGWECQSIGPDKWLMRHSSSHIEQGVGEL